MTKEVLSRVYKLAVIGVSGLCMVWAMSNLSADASGWSFAVVLLFTVLITPRMSIALPRSKFILSFSDSIIFLTFIFYGGGAAILLGATEAAANSLYLKRRGIKFGKSIIPFNIAVAVISTTLSFLAWSVFRRFSNADLNFDSTGDLLAALTFLAVAQFLFGSSLVAVLSSIIRKNSFWQIWRRDCFASSLTYAAGATLAFVAYKVIAAPDFLTITVVTMVAGIVYVSYRQTIKEINRSIEQAEQAEREKTEVVQLKAQEVKLHAAELEILLQKEEQINEALVQSKDALEHAAFHDFLTDLPNRTYLVERLNLLIEIGIEISQKYYVLFLDLKRFKSINDRLGHNVGDRILKLVGKRLLRLLRRKDTVARLGGDEFAIILNDISSRREAEEIAAQIYQKLAQPFLIEGHKIFSDLHIGIAPFDVEHHKPEDVLRDADIAMHYAKDNSLGVVFFDKALRSLYLEKISLEADLRFAIERGELSMHYQPLIALSDGALIGFEALLRWNHSKKGLISPAQFIPIAEDSGLIIPITKWILHETCSQIAEWQQLAAPYNDLLVSVNISGKHLTDDGLTEDVRCALQNSRLAPSSLKLEITESAAMDDPDQSIRLLRSLKGLGIQLSIDDFGTGYSSLSYLHLLPFDALKIDRSFVSEVGERGENSEILQTIVSLAKNLRMRTFAEGIETEAQLAVLQNLGCDYGQGFLMSKPLPKDVMEKLLYRNHHWLPVAEMESTVTASEQAAKTTCRCSDAREETEIQWQNG
ncbi:MAG: EAL domain-containing protein [Acidobacteriota bacterium]|nr:EAL domain-containing protein [Acidobacteriota bacterium]